MLVVLLTSILISTTISVYATNATNYTYPTKAYPASLLEGIIGSTPTQKWDNPNDNTFHIEIKETISTTAKAYLVYDLYGVQDHTAVSRSINDQFAVGGYFVQKTSDWIAQQEQINPTWLKQGTNLIRFSVAEQAEHFYKVRNVRIVIEEVLQVVAIANELVLNTPSLNYYSNQAYVKGYIKESTVQQASVFVDGTEAVVMNGEFEAIVERPQIMAEETWESTVRVLYSDGEIMEQKLTFEQSLVPDHSYGFSQKTASVWEAYLPSNVTTIALEAMQVDLPANSISTATTLSLTALRTIDLPPLEASIVNVTSHHKAVRFSPSDLSFQEAVAIELGYDESKIPAGYTADDIQTFVYDYAAQAWKQTNRTKVDFGKSTIASSSNQGGDYINGIIQVPESPETSAYTPTSMKDIKAANPSAGINLMQPPSANNMGTANVSYPINIPGGRQGLQPSLALSYNSGGDNSWCGVGWNLNVPAITVDTRWGVPRYDKNKETEIYSLNGQQLLTYIIDMIGQEKNYMPHRSEFMLRNKSDEKRRFYPRVEGSFQKIVRYGRNPDDYWWEVTDKSGVCYSYGGTRAGGVDDRAVLRDDTGNIAHWALAEIRDLNSNYVRYHHTMVEDVGVVGGSVKGRQLYCERITYTGHGNTPGKYSVVFTRDRDYDVPAYQKRKDVTINGRYGFKQVTADLLRKIDVQFDNQPIRSYELQYKEGAFYKTLLSNIVEYDAAGNVFTTHELAYFDDVRDEEDTYVPLAGKEDWNPHNDDIKGGIMAFKEDFIDNASALGGNKSKGGGLGTTITVGPNDGKHSKSNTAGASFGFSFSDNEGLLAMVDINGDGLADKVFKRQSGGLFFRPNQSGPNGTEEYGEDMPIHGISNFSKGKSRTLDFGVESNFGVYAGLKYSNTKGTTSTYFTDANGDQLIDIVKDGVVYFNYLVDGIPTFTPSSTLTPSPIRSNGSVDASLVDTVAQQLELEETIDRAPLHDAVRTWIAPYNGVVRINGTIQLVEDMSEEGTAYTADDGVRVAIQHDIMELWSTTIHAGDFVPIQLNDAVDSIPVLKGERIYFRVQSVFDGAYDQVDWSPTITYYSYPDRTDANGLKTHEFNADKDFLLSSPMTLGIPISGTVTIKSNFKKPITSDEIIVEILHRTTATEQILIKNRYSGQLENDNLSIGLSNLVVNKDDELYFRVSASSNVDWSALEWNPVVYYTSENDPNVELEQLTKARFYPAIDYRVFNTTIALSEPWSMYNNPLGVPFPIDVQPALVLAPNMESDSIVFTVKRENELLGKKVIRVNNGVITTNQPVNILAPINDGVSLFFEYHTTNKILAEAITSTDVFISQFFPLPTQEAIMGGLYTMNDTLSRFGPLYRHWGQFVYNGNKERAEQPINQTELVLEDFYANAMPADLSSGLPPTIDASNLDAIGEDMMSDHAAGGGTNPASTKFVPMMPDMELGAWKGYDDLTYIRKEVVSSSRLGQDDIAPINPIIENTLGGGAGATAIKKVNKTNNISLSIGAGPIGQSYSGGQTKPLYDYMDMNGDRYPDLVSEGKIQYTLPTGGLEDATRTPYSGNIHESWHFSTGASLGGTFPKSKGGNSEKVSEGQKTSSSETDAKSSAGFGLNASFNSNIDDTHIAWLDVNGDGLPDRVDKDGGVRLNLGYKFAPKENWGFGNLSGGSSITYSGGGSFNIDNASFSFGVGYSRTENGMEHTLQDMNGDGLLDYVLASDPLLVYINTGNGFANPIVWQGANAVSADVSTGQSANAAITLCVPISPLPPLKLCINPAPHGSFGSGRTRVQINDIDGDGYPDFLESNRDKDLSVKRSTIRRTNKLKSIKRPLGAEITMDYQRVGNTYEMPNSVWALSEVVLHDGFEGDGADVLRTRYVYEDGFYNRHEREFYGFKTVHTEQLDIENEDAVYRQTAQIFLNDDYYQKGLIKSEKLSDGAENAYIETIYDYRLQGIREGEELPNNFIERDNDAAFPAVYDMQKHFYEGRPKPQKASRISFLYDRYGNLTRYVDFGDIDPNGGMTNITSDDDYETIIEYHNEPGLYIVGIPKEIKVEDSNGNIYRNRVTEIEPMTGNLTKVRRFLEDGSSGDYDISYDAYGNIETLMRPENHQGERLSFTYTYDPAVQIFPAQVTDSYGYTSSSTFDYRFGQVLTSTDMNGQVIYREIDDVGRLTRFIGPYESAADVDYTIKFEYAPKANVPYALTQHYDPQHPDNPMETATFIDGLTRVLQVKKDGDVYDPAIGDDVEKRIVSGRVLFDAFGRTTTTHYPVEEEMGTAINNFNPAFDNIQPTTTTYDVLDRTQKISLPDGAMTETRYDFANDRDGNKQFLTKVIDANGNEKDQYTNVRGLVTATLDYIDDAPEHGDIWTSYQYNAINELIRVSDDHNNETLSEYDWYGRRISRDHPDHGFCTYTYDQADNMIAKQTANIRAYDEEAAIRYIYDRERLTDIKYPINPSNNVHYEYGDPTSENDVLYNRMGRISFQADATGSQIFYYDRLGEVNKNERTITVIQGQPPRTFTTRSKYDTWNRITRMVYPDGEVLDYKYNRGGKLRDMGSEKLEVDYSYIDQLGYDKFEQRVYCKYGNGTKTTYAYEPARRRLQNMVVQLKGSSRTIMNNDYRYDKVTNILSIKNNAFIPLYDMGGPAEQTFEYDDLYRLVGAKGYWGNYRQVQKYELNMRYNSVHDIVNKRQQHQRSAGSHIDPYLTFPNQQVNWESIDQGVNDWEWSNFTSHNFDYQYNAKQPHAATQVGYHQYKYDDNGNLMKRQNLVFFGQKRQFIWDEEDRLMTIDDDERIHNYVYDANGIRVVKQRDIANYVYVNGELVIGGDPNGDYTVYINPQMVVTEGGYTKHFYIEGQRIASKIGLGGPYGLGTNWGDWENWTNWDPWDNWANNDNWDDWYTDGNWESQEGVWNDYINVQERFQYFFHSDHLGSASYITDQHGEVHQHLEYLPFGELFVQEHRNFDRTPYLFNGKELDEETGLYYYGARYYDPAIARWLSVDPLAERDFTYSPYNYTRNNPIVLKDPDGKFWHIAVGAAVGAVINVAYQAYQGNVNSISDGLKAAGVGAAAGGLTAATGGLAASAMSGAGAVSTGIVVGGTSAAVGGFVEGAGNAKIMEGKSTSESLKAGLKDGLVGGTIGAVTGGLGSKLNNVIKTKGVSKNINSGKQGKHIKGHNNYQEGKSILKKDAQSLLDDFHSGKVKSSQKINNTKTRVDFGENIGNYVNEKGISPTSKGIIHNSNKGAHIVPSRPE